MKLKAIKFILSGDAACFRKPDVNEKVYFTYNNIHRIALLGLLGAILGLKGYRNQELFSEKEQEFPEFYDKLSPIKVAIVPNAERGYFSKKTQYFNNSVGYANRDGGNLMVYEQWLENPGWTIYLVQGNLAEVLWEKLCNYLLNNQCIYIPYLGKNDFPAIISDVEVCELEEATRQQSLFIHSLFAGELDVIDDSETVDDELPYIFSEYAPVALQEKQKFYRFARLLYTNCAIKNITGELFQDAHKIICFL